jgi:hypothetical protein
VGSSVHTTRTTHIWVLGPRLLLSTPLYFFAFTPGHVPLSKFEFEADQLFMLIHSHMVLELTSPPFGYLSPAEQLRTKPDFNTFKLSRPSSERSSPVFRNTCDHRVQGPRVNLLTIFAVGNNR